MTISPMVALESERSLLGGLLISCNGWPPEAELLSPDHFSCPVRAKIFGAMARLKDANEPVDTITVLGELKHLGSPPKSGWATYLTELSNLTPTAANADHYATLVLRESRRRDYVDVMSEAVDSARKVGADADTIATGAAIELGHIADGRQIARPSSMKEIMRAEFADLGERLNSGSVIGHTTGFAGLDDLTCGLVPGHLIVIAGRPSMGKSSLVRNILVNLAMKHDVGSLLFSFEMSKEEIGQAAIASEGRVNLQKLRTADLTPPQYDRVVEGMAALNTNRLQIVDRPGMKISEIRTVARAFASRHPLGVIAVDYIQLAEGEGNNREQEIASISRGLKGLAKELRVAMIGLSQLNRGLEKRDDKRPKLSDLRESGSIEQDADEVFFLYRDEYYNRDTEEKGVAEVGIAKSRNGPTGMVRLKWFGEYTRFESFKSGPDQANLL
jgi:replicative DNA helicase